MIKIIAVCSLKEKEEMIKLGYKFLFTQGREGSQIYIFEENNKLNLSDKIKEIRTFSTNKIFI